MGRTLEVNGHRVSIFRIGSLLLATEEACAHMGGSMSLGDIEVWTEPASFWRLLFSRSDTPWWLQDVGGVACIVCPSHGWSYDIISGQCVGRPVRSIRVSMRNHNLRMDRTPGCSPADLPSAGEPRRTAYDRVRKDRRLPFPGRGILRPEYKDTIVTCSCLTFDQPRLHLYPHG